MCIHEYAMMLAMVKSSIFLYGYNMGSKSGNLEKLQWKGVCCYVVLNIQDTGTKKDF